MVDFLPIIDAGGRLQRVQIIGLRVKSRLGQNTGLENKETQAEAFSHKKIKFDTPVSAHGLQMSDT